MSPYRITTLVGWAWFALIPVTLSDYVRDIPPWLYLSALGVITLTASSVQAELNRALNTIRIIQTFDGER